MNKVKQFTIEIRGLSVNDTNYNKKIRVLACSKLEAIEKVMFQHGWVKYQPCKDEYKVININDNCVTMQAC